jgi:release factor glutamine methyltransferase
MAFSRDLPHSYGDALRVAREILSARSDLVRRGVVETEAELILRAAVKQATGEELRRAELVFRHAHRLADAAGAALIKLAGARAQGALLQHLTGGQAFLSHEYECGPGVLTPRPETEALADLMVRELRAPGRGLEVGIGSGVLSVELLFAFPGLRMDATELSERARAYAERNAARILGASASRLRILPARAGEVLEPLQGGAPADFLVSNPPYLKGPEEADEEVARHEPAEALFAPKGDALHFYRAIAAGGAALLRPGAPAYLEVPHERAEEARAVFVAHGWQTRLEADLTGRPRILVAAAPDARGE